MPPLRTFRTLARRAVVGPRRDPATFHPSTRTKVCSLIAHRHGQATHGHPPSVRCGVVLGPVPGVDFLRRPLGELPGDERLKLLDRAERVFLPVRNRFHLSNSCLSVALAREVLV